MQGFGWVRVTECMVRVPEIGNVSATTITPIKMCMNITHQSHFVLFFVLTRSSMAVTLVSASLVGLDRNSQPLTQFMQALIFGQSLYAIPRQTYMYLALKWV